MAKYFYLDALRIGASVDQNGVVTQYIYGTKPNIPDLAVRKVGATTTVYRILSDHLGSPRMLVSITDGSVVFEGGK